MAHPETAVGTSSKAPADRQLFVAVVEEDCTGCNTCVDHCLVDCIEPAVPNSDHRASHAIRIREDECIGCFVCAKVCEELAVNAIRLVPTEAARSGTGVQQVAEELAFAQAAQKGPDTRRRHPSSR